MKKTSTIRLAILIALMLLVGCKQPYTPPTQTEPTITPTMTMTDEPPVDMTWISPGKVMVSNFHEGARAEYPLLIHNGNDYVTSFSVSARVADSVGEGYVKATEDIVQNWVIVADPAPILMPKETREILVILIMPGNAESPGEQWEFWVSVKDTSQAGMVKVELCVRWLITMRV